MVSADLQERHFAQRFPCSEQPVAIPAARSSTSPQFFPSDGSRPSSTRGNPLAILDLTKGRYVIDTDGNVTGVAGADQAAQPCSSVLTRLRPARIVN